MTQATCTCPKPDAPLAVRRCCPVHCCAPAPNARLTEGMAMTNQTEPIDPIDTSVCQTCGESDPYRCECDGPQDDGREAPHCNTTLCQWEIECDCDCAPCQSAKAERP